MTDSLGQSQVLPYLVGLSKLGYAFTLLSFEKPARYAAQRSVIEQLVQQAGIVWHPLSYTQRPPVVATLWDVLRMHLKALQLHRKQAFAAVHCRSYLAALVGLSLKQRFGMKFIFDLRGFWADERVEGGLWPLQNPLYRLVYKYFKRKEQAFMAHADGIVSLTEAGKQEMETWPARQLNPQAIDVIPCAADFTHFSLATDELRAAAKIALGLQPGQLVVGYLGSLGTWYMLDEMLAFFAAVKAKYAEAIFLILTPDDPALVFTKALNHGLTGADFIIRYATREEVVQLLPAANLSVCFIKPVYSKLSSSPTKLGELLAMGIPVVANTGVGDVAAILHTLGGGHLVNDFSAEELELAVQAIPRLLALQPKLLRERAFQYYDLSKGVSSYAALYASVLNLLP